MSRLADLIVKGPWVIKGVEPWGITFDSEEVYETFLAQAIAFKDAVEPLAILPVLAMSANDPKAAELMNAKLKILMGIPGMVAAIRGAIPVMREMSADPSFSDSRDKIAIQKLEDALRAADLSVPLA